MIALALLLAAPTLPQAAPPAPPILAPVPAGMVRVALVTSIGTITLDLERTRAPVTTANFVRYVDQHRLDGTVFYRTVRPAADFGFVQFGVQNAPKRVLPPIAHEPSTQTGVKHLDGAISLARNAPGTGQGDFTINVADQPSLDADPTKSGDNLGYAAFGHVVAGMDVVKRILDAPVDPARGPFKGEAIADPVKLLSARRMAAPAASGGSGGGT